MAVKDLTFRQVGKHYETEFVSEGKAVIHLVRDKGALYSGYLIYANLEGLEREAVDAVPADGNVIFELDIPQGVTVTIVSETAVKQAKMSVV